MSTELTREDIDALRAQDGMGTSDNRREAIERIGQAFANIGCSFRDFERAMDLMFAGHEFGGEWARKPGEPLWQYRWRIDGVALRELIERLEKANK